MGRAGGSIRALLMFLPWPVGGRQVAAGAEVVHCDLRLELLLYPVSQLRLRGVCVLAAAKDVGATRSRAILRRRPLHALHGWRSYLVRDATPDTNEYREEPGGRPFGEPACNTAAKPGFRGRALAVWGGLGKAR